MIRAFVKVVLVVEIYCILDVAALTQKFSIINLDFECLPEAY